MVAINRDAPRPEPTAAVTAPVIAIPSPEENITPEKEKGITKQEEEEEAESDQKGDPEMAPAYLRRLLPIFTKVYQSTMLPSVR